MKCNYCQRELNPEAELDTCPACGFPVGGESAASGKTVTLAAKSLQHRDGNATERPGSLRITRKSEVCRTRHLRILLLIDISFSMDGEKIEQVRAALSKMIHFLLPLEQHCSLGVVQFNSRASVAHSWCRPDELEGRIELREPDGATNIGAALRRAGQLFADHPIEKDSEQVIVLLSDGEDTCNSLPAAEAATQKANGNLIITIAYGDDADRELLRDIASSPELFFAKGTDGKELETFLLTLGQTLTASIQTGQDLNRSLSRIE